jgi:cell division septum initiation protein DivIVA
VDLERRAIERTDFALVARGYDRGDVDDHLRAIADAVEELRRAGPEPPLASAAAARVQAIVEAAERSASELVEAARAEAERTTALAARQAGEERDRARREAVERARELERAAAEREAGSRARHLERAAAEPLERARTLREELDRVVGQLRATVEALEGALREGAAALTAEPHAAHRDRDERTPREGEEARDARPPEGHATSPAPAPTASRPARALASSRSTWR